MAKLVCQAGPDAGHEYPLTKDVSTMGRSSTSDVQIKDHMSSRNHCEVRRDGKLYTLVDLGSRNGTRLNDKKVSERQLAYGDHIRVGECEWLLVKESGDVELKDLLSKYELQEKIGEGGMGVVYKVVQKSMARTVALKILSAKYASRPKFVEQFIKEARAAGQLNHPNIIQVHDVATENGIHFFSMEFVDGPTCMQLLKANGSFPVPEALEITRQVAKALEYAHEHRLIHQDIKPDNIMVGANNLVKLADLGISKTFDEAESEDGPKRVMGTPHYMAPEAALGKKIDHRVDLYSLGTTLYHLLTGKTPFTGTSATEVLKAQVMDPLPSLKSINPNVPDAVITVVERLMAKKPDDRYQSATELVDEIKRLQATLDLGSNGGDGSETQILQRLAKGTPGAGIDTPNEPSTGRSTGVAVTGEQNIESKRLRLVFILGIVAVILFFAILQVPRFLRDDNPSDGNDPANGETNPTDNPQLPMQQAPPDPNIQLSRQITSIEDALGNNSATDLGALQTQVETILAANPNAANRIRAERLQARLVATLHDRERAQQEQAWANVRGQVEQLTGERNYDMALRRLNSFAFKDSTNYKDRFTNLLGEITKDRDRFTTDINDKITAYVARRDATQLRDLRERLPQSLLGSDLEKRIQTELAKLDKDAQERHQQSLSDLAEALTRFDVTKAEEIHRLNRRSMGDSKAGETADAMLAAAKKLPPLITALNTSIRTTEAHKFRYIGELQRMHNPDLLGARTSGLIVQAPVGSGEIELSWKTIDPTVLNDVINQVLGASPEHQSTLDALAKARTLLPQ